MVDQYLQIVENLFYYGDTVGAREGAVDSVRKRIKSGLSKFRDLLGFWTSRALSLGAKCRLYFAYVHNIMLYMEVRVGQ